ncbi:MAG TPA: hypothetical protein DIT99_29800 [Candidatus Latescibacteria bacterium]|nr:hypothetical protein [Candidatus Latescibacterota bacterium]
MPFGIATDAAGNVYVSDFTNNRIQKFDSSGIHLLSFGSQGIVDGTFQFPRDLTVDASGNIWVADTNNNRVQKFDCAGNHLLSLGSNGSFGRSDIRISMPQIHLLPPVR